MFLYISIGAAVAVIAGILLAVCTKRQRMLHIPNWTKQVGSPTFF